jgi:hypothetical protein
MGIQSKEGYHPAAAQRHLANVERHMPKDGQASFGSMRSLEDFKTPKAGGRRPPASRAPFYIKWSGA